MKSANCVARGPVCCHRSIYVTTRAGEFADPAFSTGWSVPIGRVDNTARSSVGRSQGG